MPSCRLVVLAVLTALVVAAPAGAAPQPRLPVPGNLDVNGDGRDDIVFAFNDPHIFTVFGKTDRAFVDVRTPGSWGQTISGPFGPLPGAHVAGDFNGDGRADIQTADANTLETLIVAGGPDRGAISAESQVPALRLRNGADSGPIGDVNGDGLDDLAVQPPETTPPRRNDVVGIVFGSRTPATADAAAGGLATRITLSRSRVGRRRPDLTLQGVGDFDSDGIGDVALTASGHPLRACRSGNGLSRRCPGRVWIIYGRRDWPARVDARTLRRDEGFSVQVRGALARGARFGEITDAIAAGDLDGDGYDDTLVSLLERLIPVYAVVWGSRHRRVGPVVVNARTSRIRDEHFHGVFPVADFDGDGRGDLLASPDLGPDEDFPDRRLRTFLLRGKRWSGVRTKRPRRARDGYVLFHRVEFASSPADVNGDGLADVFAGPPSFDDADTGFVVFGDKARRRVNPSKPHFRGFRFGLP